MKFSKKPFDEFLQYANENSFLLKPTASAEIINLISSRNKNYCIVTERSTQKNIRYVS